MWVSDCKWVVAIVQIVDAGDMYDPREGVGQLFGKVEMIWKRGWKLAFVSSDVSCMLICFLGVYKLIDAVEEEIYQTSDR